MMLIRPVLLQSHLERQGHLDDIYSVMDNDDTSEIVMTALGVLKKTNIIPALNKVTKTETVSTAHRNDGNKAFKEEKYQTAFEFYNKALLHAPKDSRAMKLAYSNRSALLLNVKAFSACLRDIETCFSMGCPDDIVKKLKKRKEEARAFVCSERSANVARQTVFSEEFFKMNSRRNPQIPCASTKVGVVMENQVPKVVATTNIKVGTLLAVETAFATQTVKKNFNSACYHCQKFTYNLIPCNNCCFALFCNEECMEASIKEYHGVECQFIENIDVIITAPTSVLAMKTLLKIRSMCNNWEELVAASYDFGVERMKNSSINDIFDVNQKFSVFNFKNDKHFVYGAMFNACFGCAVLIQYLDNVKSFFPQCPGEKNDAMRAVSRILMFLTLYGVNTQMRPPVALAVPNYLTYHDHLNYGWFSFVGKLRNSCNPNMKVVSLNNTVALIALQPIKRGTELTISYLGHYLSDYRDTEVHKRNMFVFYKIACNCYVCSGEWETNDKYHLTEVQKKMYRKLNLKEMFEKFCSKDVPHYYPKVCKALTCLNDVPYSKQYKEVFDMFMQCVLAMQELNTNNVMINQFGC